MPSKRDKEGINNIDFESTSSRARRRSDSCGGVRTAFVVFDLKDPSQLPAISEPLFSKVKATIEMFPVMDQEDLQKGLQQVGEGA